jgi:branched-chain amino acid transport system substrate-binding protein
VGAEFGGKFLKAKSVYFLHDKTAYGQGVAEFFRDFAPKSRIKVVGFEGTEERSNFDPILNAIRARNPGVIYFGGICDQAGVFFKQALANGIKAQFLGPDGMDSSDPAKIGRDSGVGMYYTSAGGPASFFSRAGKFVQDYKKKFGIDPGPYAAQSYDAGAIALKATENATRTAGGKKPTREQVSTEIRRLRGFKGYQRGDQF